MTNDDNLAKNSQVDEIVESDQESLTFNSDDAERCRAKFRRQYESIPPRCYDNHIQREHFQDNVPQ